MHTTVNRMSYLHETFYNFIVPVKLPVSKLLTAFSICKKRYFSVLQVFARTPHTQLEYGTILDNLFCTVEHKPLCLISV